MYVRIAALVFASLMMFAAIGTLNYGDMQYALGNYDYDQTENILEALKYVLIGLPIYIWLMFFDERRYNG